MQKGDFNRFLIGVFDSYGTVSYYKIYTEKITSTSEFTYPDEVQVGVRKQVVSAIKNTDGSYRLKVEADPQNGRTVCVVIYDPTTKIVNTWIQ